MKQFYSILLTSILLILLHNDRLKAQSPLFSAYQNTELALNPAMTGVDNLIGAQLSYRTQRYNSGLRLNTANLQLQYTLAKEDLSKKWGGVALVAETDKATQGVPYSYYSIKANAAHQLKITNGQYLSLGLQLSYNQQSFDANNFTTGNQWVVNQGYDQSLATGEVFSSERSNYFSAGAGFVWYQFDDYQFRKNYFGLAAFHLNKPSYNFSNEEIVVPVRYTAMGGVSVFEKNRLGLLLDGMGSLENSLNFWSLGPRLRKSFENNDPFDPFTSGYIEMYSRYFSTDKIALGTMIGQDNFSVGFNVDLHLNQSAQSASTEFSFSVFKRVRIGKQETIDTLSADYMIGESRQFEEDDIFSKEPVKDIEQVYQNTVTDDFSFELRKNFNYGFNATTLNDEAKAFIKDLAVLLNANGALKLKVTGHTDNIGTKEGNQTISEERAKSVTAYLEELGIAKERLSFEGLGATVPLYKNNSEENRAKNRRVEFLIYAETK